MAVAAVLLFMLSVGGGVCENVYEFQDVSYVVSEGSSVRLTVQRTSTEDQSVFIPVVLLDADADFIGTSLVAVFQPSDLKSSVSFTTRDDNIPEPRETFTAKLQNTSSNIKLGVQSTTVLIIESNDDAAGVFSFSVTQPIQTTEGQTVSMLIVRDRGTFGSVLLNYVTSSSDGQSIDVSPTSGGVLFTEGQISASISFLINDDSLPEHEETISVSLTTDDSDAKIGSGVRQLRITENDAPVRFKQAEIITGEVLSEILIQVEVIRGRITPGADIIGDINSILHVNYSLYVTNATYGQDFNMDNGTLMFESGQTNSTFDVQILPDDLPELTELLEIKLISISGDGVIIQPEVQKIIILGNDDQNGVISLVSLEPIILSEDGNMRNHTFIVKRTGGLFGRVSVNYLLSAGASYDLYPMSGTVTLNSGVNQSEFSISTIQDSIPEATESYVVSLSSVSGGARIAGPQNMTIIIQDSDLAHGSVQWQETGHYLQTDTNPRRLWLHIERVGGALEDITAHITFQYLVDSEEINGIFQNNASSRIVLMNNQATTSTSIPIVNTAFLVEGAVFQANISSVSIENAAVQAYNSPIIGTRNMVSVSVTDSEANGIIGLLNLTTISVVEPNTGFNEVSILVTRVGVSGEAQILWLLEGITSKPVNQSDVEITNGSITLIHGESAGVIKIKILSDEIAETRESMKLKLISVSPPGTQKLNAGNNEVIIEIEENDNPGGIFQLAQQSRQHLFVTEGESFAVTVERTAGSLVQRSIYFSITPNTALEFYGSTGVLTFDVGETQWSSTIVVNNDQIPELAELYTLSISSYGNQPSQLGDHTAVNITILSNDDPYGLIHFIPDTHHFLYESKMGNSSTVEIPVLREAGLFDSVTVYWKVNTDSTADIQPISGNITFQPDQSESSLIISSTADMIPEDEEIFEIRLYNASGGAEISEPNKITITIVKNDAAVYFQAPSRIRVSEGSKAVLTLTRIYADKQISVGYLTKNSTAQLTDYGSFQEGRVTFPAGASEVQIEIPITDDNIPEREEIFYIQLHEAEGDAVVYGESLATVIIEANDNSNGVFRFAAPYLIQVRESDTISFTVMRGRGLYRDVTVYWKISYSNGTRLSAGVEFSSVSGSLIFNEGESEKTLELSALTDQIPEYGEQYLITLFNTTGGGPAPESGVISPEHNSITIEILTNDDPNGVLLFAADSREVAAAEDYLPGDENSTSAVFNIERKQGTFGEIKVLWEVFSGTVSGVFPDVSDLLFLSEYPESVLRLNTGGRSDSQSINYHFTGNEGSFAQVSNGQQELSVTGDFAMSVWMKPQANSNGYILSKTAEDNSLNYYSIKITADTQGTPVTITLSLTDVNQVETTLDILWNVTSRESNWNHLLINVESNQAYFFFNGILVTQKIVPVNRLDGSDIVVIGASGTGINRYSGFLQELRLYSRPLTPAETTEVVSYPAHLDVTPINGIRTLSAGETTTSIQIHTVQDIESESNEVLSLRLVNTKGGGRISQTDSIGKLTVLKSDNANGLFGFKSDCQPSLRSEGTKFVCTINRDRGDADVVEISWQIAQIFADDVMQIAREDFNKSSGSVVFQPGQLRATISFVAIEDNKPELEESYRVILTSAVSSSGPGSTADSGASINDDSSSVDLFIESNDIPSGLIQFSESQTESELEIIPPATKQPQVLVREDSGVVSLLVERAQGLIGSVSVEWRTEDGTASSNNQQQPDYVASAGSLTFVEGEQYSFINITIIDDLIPEPDVFFTVNLINPRGGAELAIASMIRVVITNSDDAFGIFSFDPSSRTKLLTESNIAHMNYTLTIKREAGQIGESVVSWQIFADSVSDFMYENGSVSFDSSQQSADITIIVKSDGIPELDESYIIRLMNASQGRLGDGEDAAAALTILANDDPYGVFSIKQHGSPIQTDEHDDVIVTISRTNGLIGLVNITFMTVSPDFNSDYFPLGVVRAEAEDFVNTVQQITFEPGDNQQNVTVRLQDDTTPEPNESLFVVISNPVLISGGQSRPLNTSPRLASESRTYGQIIILSNDFANGVLSLSTATITVQENVGMMPVFVNRSAGNYGEVTVRFEVIPLTATANVDYFFISNNVLLSDRETSKQVPVQINDDNFPELSETFTIRLLDYITGGAQLGFKTECNVTIEPSDDPQGAFGFASFGQTVDEPAEGSTVVDIRVNRMGGSMDIVSVQWMAEYSDSGESAASDVEPTYGTIYFTSNQASQLISLQVISDNIPENTEMILINLTSATNGGRITELNTFILTIEPNDNPHGVVQFNSSQYYLIEKEESSNQHVIVERSGGLFGDLIVYYSTVSITLPDLIKNQKPVDQTNLWFYNVPQTAVRNISGTTVDVSANDNPIQGCAVVCLLDWTCGSFQFNSESLSCEWFEKTSDREYLAPSANSQHYNKHASHVSNLYNSQAQPGNDFIMITMSSAVIPEGHNSALLPVTILPDTQPELNELFYITIDRLELAGGVTPSSSNRPTIGPISKTIGIIRSNDDANGILRIYSGDPRATDSGQRISVEERQQFSLELIVERLGGSIGDISVTWGINSLLSNASRQTDYVADGATLNFPTGDNMRVITVGIQDDATPELDEVLVVELFDPEGGSLLDERSSVTVTISANDNVAGKLAFQRSSYITQEGSDLEIVVKRSVSSHGVVIVNWIISGLLQSDPRQAFNQITGQLVFNEFEDEKTIPLQVLADEIPEINEEYQIQLLNVSTIGIPGTGAAVIDVQGSLASITIQASNEPHGIFSLAANSLSIEVDEGREAYITVDRKFGAIGEVNVYYTIYSGSITPLEEELLLATINQDVVGGTYFITFSHTQQSGEINLNISDDNIPEVKEVFLVNLTRVELVSDTETGFLPSLSDSNLQSEVFISANDGTHGRLAFPSEFLTYTVNETSHNLTIPIVRELGSYGEVSAFIFSQSQSNAVLGQDYSFTAIDIVFLPGESEKYVTVQIFDDETPEATESFQIVLASPRGGVTLSDNRVSTIVIDENDGAGGFIQFSSTSDILLDESFNPSGHPTSIDLILTRGPGIFGILSVGFEVKGYGETVEDLTPISGSIRFDDQQSNAVISLLVIDDDIPELSENFYIELTSDFPLLLGENVRRNFTILPNDFPNGLLSLQTANGGSSDTVEEKPQNINLLVKRSMGTMGAVSVDVYIQPQTAQARLGSYLKTAEIYQTGFQVSGYCSHNDYLVVLNKQTITKFTSSVGSNGKSTISVENEQSQILKWNGVYESLAFLETNLASDCLLVEELGTTYIVLLNKGAPGSTETYSRLYSLGVDGPTVLQDLRTSGASNTFLYTSANRYFIAVMNTIDNDLSERQNITIYELLNGELVIIQNLATVGPRAMDKTKIDSQMYCAVLTRDHLMLYSIQGPVWSLLSSEIVQSGHDVAFMTSNPVQLAVVKTSTMLIYAFDPNKGEISLIDTIDQSQFMTLNVFHLSAHTFISTNDGTYRWNGSLIRETEGINSSVPLQSSDSVSLPLLLGSTGQNGTVSLVMLLEENADYIPIRQTVRFNPGEDEAQLLIPILNDESPEDSERFLIGLSDPVGGASINNSLSEVTVMIQSNDNAFGIIQFTEESLSLRVSESAEDTSVQFNIQRTAGNVGRVVLSWNIISDTQENLADDIEPLSGLIEFSPGQTLAQLSITIKSDGQPERDEDFKIVINEIIESGTSIPGRGAVLGDQRTASLTILSNESPHGVIRWERNSVIASEPDYTDISVNLRIVREQGMSGALQITYITSRDDLARAEDQATSGEDYISKQETVIMADNQTLTSVDVVIKGDITPEIDEQFIVNLTQVRLLGGSLIADIEPSIRSPGDILTVIIAENDDARGIVRYDIQRNNEGRLDVYEIPDDQFTVRLKLVRTDGLYGNIQVNWQILFREASNSDVTPNDGVVEFTEGQNSAFIELFIQDDQIPEPLETFDVQLINVIGGATLGSFHTIRLAIIKNDSPNGMFSFEYLEYSVRESENEFDQSRAVQINVVRSHAFQGVVNVAWQLSPEAEDDFELPHSGSLRFAENEQRNSFTLMTKRDGNLEGEEEFLISLLSADNNADLSVTHRTARVVIEANEGASGVVQVVKQNREIIISEPFADYDGSQTITLSRGIGRFGEVMVTWVITPFSTDNFITTEGEAIFADGQQTVEVNIQTRDDNQPETRHTFTFKVTSATGGALIGTSSTSTIHYAASDQPYGVFEFDTQNGVLVTEGGGQVSVSVVRKRGVSGQVRVGYVAISGSASRGEDFQPNEGYLTFVNGQRQQSIVIRILEDEIPEGPEVFSVNLTSIILVSPVDVNFTLLNDISLDQPPIIGEISSKLITIDKNDNSEGIVQIGVEGMEISVNEEDGLAVIPIVRTSGNYGDIGVIYSIFSGTADSVTDFLLDNGTVILISGQTYSSINVTIVNDIEQEMNEYFTVNIVSATGGALLGGRTTSRVTILKSDYPNGRFHFVGPSTRTLTNPVTDTNIEITIRRSDGFSGKQTVSYRILGPNSNTLLEGTSDITILSAGGEERTRGELTWNDGVGGDISLSVIIKSYSGWEIQKEFVVIIFEINNDVSVDQNGEVDPLAGNVTIIVEKHGDPNGIIKFSDVNRVNQEFTEQDTDEVVSFHVDRLQGTLGNQELFWEIYGGESDFDPMSGSIEIPAGTTRGVIRTNLLADDKPEVEETFQLQLRNVLGGATIQTNASVLYFKIKPNDDPHGLFELIPEEQTIMVSSVTLIRSIGVRIRRNAGNVGAVRVTFGATYSQAGTNLPAEYSIAFADGQSLGNMDVQVAGNIFFPNDSYFTIALSEVVYLGGSDIAAPPRLGSSTEVNLPITEEAANSVVQFNQSIVNADQQTHQAEVNITRVGTYGIIEVNWASGYPQAVTMDEFTQGAILPNTGSVLMRHGDSTALIKVNLVLPANNVPSLYAIHFPSQPYTSASGGAKLQMDKSYTEIDPYGLIQMKDTSLMVNENSESVVVSIERVYGSKNNVQITYTTIPRTASAFDDFTPAIDQTVIMQAGQSTADISISVKLDSHSEQNEVFIVNITDVMLLPTTESYPLSPRISLVRRECEVTIGANGDPNGLLDITVSPKRVIETVTNQLTVSVRRTAGRFGQITTRVRTVGGGEPWDELIAIQARSEYNDTISQALSNRDSRRSASAGADYQIVNELVTLRENEVEREITLYLNDDGISEPDEQVFLYLTDVTGGARIAQGSSDGYKYGYTSLEIIRSEDYNGVIGFSTSSQNVTISEDLNPVVMLSLTRSNGASYTYDTSVQWEVISSNNADIENDLKNTQGSFTCASLQNTCTLVIELNPDNTPEFGYSFLIRLFNAGVGAKIDEQRSTATVNVLSSDNPYGEITFNSERVIVSKNDQLVSIQVDRRKGLSFDVAVSYLTEKLSADDLYIAGVKTYSAAFGSDYERTSGTLTFGNSEDMATINIGLLPGVSTTLSYPKAFKVIISNPQFGVVLGTITECSVVIVESPDVPVWDIAASASSSLLDENGLDYILNQILAQDFSQLNTETLSILEYILRTILQTAEQRPLTNAQRRALISIFCNLMSDNVRPAKGRLSLSRLFERFIFTLTVGRQCENMQIPYEDISCDKAKFGVAKLYPYKINGFQYSSTIYKDTLKLGTVLETDLMNRSCDQVQFIEYTTDWWFSPDSTDLLNSRVLATNIKGSTLGAVRSSDTPLVSYKIFTPDGSRTSKRANCVYYDEDREQWTDGRGVCKVVNSLELGTSNYVECECSHLSSYAVTSLTRLENEIGYPSWMFIIAGTCMFCLLLTLITYLVCKSAGQFTVKITMHLVFCLLATLTCYVCSALFSSDLAPEQVQLLVQSDSSNYKCIIMGVILHYFILTQFLWIFIQSGTLWCIFVRNDEYTERYHWIFILLGYVLPLAFVGGFYGVTYYLYVQIPLDPNFMYGDVNNENEMCFLTNSYPALGGIVAPVVLCLLGGLFFVADIGCRGEEWQSYDDIYKNKPNKTELWPLIVFWILIVLTNITAGLHMAYNFYSVMIAFCVFLSALALFSLIYLIALRGPCINCLQSETPREEPKLHSSTLILNSHSAAHEQMLQIPQINYPSEQMRTQPFNQLNSNLWERDDDGLLRVSTPVSLSNKRESAYISTNTISRRSQLPFPDDDQTRDIGQLITAIKEDTEHGSYSYTNSATIRSEEEDNSSTTDTQSAYHVLRRISIADTHL